MCIFAIPGLQIGVFNVCTTLHAAARIEAKLKRRRRIDAPVQASVRGDARVERNMNQRIALVAQFELVIGRRLGDGVAVVVVVASGLSSKFSQ